MDPNEFPALRQRLQKTQKEMAQLLGTSIRAVQSFEQGWRKIPAHIERQILFLAAMKPGGRKRTRPCWEVERCPASRRRKCPAWEFQVGHLCWFASGTHCRGEVQESWSKKMQTCRRCPVFSGNLKMKKGKGNE